MNAIQKFEAKIAEFQQRGMTMAQATRETVVNNPDLHRDYLREYNAQHGRTI